MTRLDICNMALGEVGYTSSGLTSLGEDSTVAELCRRFIGPAVREVLNMGKWKCARAGVELPKLALTPEEKPLGWAHAYQLPEDYIRIVSFNEVDAEEQWQHLFEVRGDRLLTQHSKAYMVYVRDLSAKGEDVHVMPPLLTRAVVCNLASKLAFPLQQNTSFKQAMEQSCEIAMRRAKASGALEEFRPRLSQFVGSRWLSARGM